MSNGLPFNNKASRALSGAQGIIDERMEDMLAKNLSNSLLKMGPPSSPKLKYEMTQKLKDLMDVNEKLRQESPPGSTVFQDKMNQVSNMVNANMAPVNMAVNEQMPGSMIKNANMTNVNPPATRLAEMGGLMSMSPQARMNQGLMQFYEPVRRMQTGGSTGQYPFASEATTQYPNVFGAGSRETQSLLDILTALGVEGQSPNISKKEYEEQLKVIQNRFPDLLKQTVDEEKEKKEKERQSITEEEFDMRNQIETGGTPFPDVSSVTVDTDVKDVVSDNRTTVTDEMKDKARNIGLDDAALAVRQGEAIDLLKKSKESKDPEGFLKNLSGKDLMLMGAAFLGTTTVDAGAKASLEALVKSKESDKQHQLAIDKLESEKKYREGMLGLKAKDIDASLKIAKDRNYTSIAAAQISALAANKGVTPNAMVSAYEKVFPEFSTPNGWITILNKKADELIKSGELTESQKKAWVDQNSTNMEYKQQLYLEGLASFTQGTQDIFPRSGMSSTPSLANTPSLEDFEFLGVEK